MRGPDARDGDPPSPHAPRCAMLVVATNPSHKREVFNRRECTSRIRWIKKNASPGERIFRRRHMGACLTLRAAARTMGAGALHWWIRPHAPGSCASAPETFASGAAAPARSAHALEMATVLARRRGRGAVPRAVEAAVGRAAGRPGGARRGLARRRRGCSRPRRGLARHRRGLARRRRGAARRPSSARTSSAHHAHVLRDDVNVAGEDLHVAGEGSHDLRSPPARPRRGLPRPLARAPTTAART